MSEKSKIIFVIGGAASGKSELAERICCTVPGPRWYIAAMEPYSAEAEARIARHRAQRAQKGFETVECYRNLAGLNLPSHGGAALLEDTGNVTANQMFTEGTPPQQAASAVLKGIRHISSQVETLVIVGNEVFGGAEYYPAGAMAEYTRALGKIHREIAHRSEIVIESVCGLPLVWKGEPVF